MAYMKLLLTGALCGAFCLASAQSEGMLPRWEVVSLSKELVANVEQTRTVLGEVRPKEWLQDGAPAAYVDQQEGLHTDLQNLKLSAEALGRSPEKLSYVIDTFLWLDRVSSTVGSVAGGVRAYQSGPVADLLDSARGKGDAAMDILKEYMRQVAVQQEEAMEIADSEAQRCRGQLAIKPR
ncbi:MAG: hypothetical protein WD733_26370 [Bryobacterales bacterium]